MNTDNYIEEYYKDNAKKLHKMVDKIVYKYGKVADKEHFYSLANEVFTDVLNRYNDNSNCNFNSFLFLCLSNKVKTEITKLNREKRLADRESVSMESIIDESENTIADVVKAENNTEKEIVESEKIKEYMNGISELQQEILNMRMSGKTASLIKKELHLSETEYQNNYNQLKSFEKIKPLLGNIEEQSRKMEVQQMPTTLEKSKTSRMSVSSIVKKINNYTIRFDHHLQRESEKWNLSMKGNLISDILQGYPVPPLYFAEQVVNGIGIIWNIDGKQRCTNVYSYVNNGYKISKNIRRYMITYQSALKDENGNQLIDENGFPQYEVKEFDIRKKKFSDLPEELKDRILDYNFECVKYLNCTDDEIAYHIARYNEGKPMNAPEKGITRLSTEFAGIVKGISNMPFFKDKGGYKISESKNGTINRVVIESVMLINFFDNWKKKLEDMCTYIKDNATVEHFDDFENIVTRLENVITDDVAEMFNSKNSFIWFALFDKFTKYGLADERFIDFMREFNTSLHDKHVNGITFDALSE